MLKIISDLNLKTKLYFYIFLVQNIISVVLIKYFQSPFFRVCFIETFYICGSFQKSVN